MFRSAEQLIATNIRENKRNVETDPVDEIF